MKVSESLSIFSQIINFVIFIYFIIFLLKIDALDILGLLVGAFGLLVSIIVNIIEWNSGQLHNLKNKYWKSRYNVHSRRKGKYITASYDL